MSHKKIDENFSYYLEEYGGKFDTYDRPSEEYLQSWQGKIPTPLINFWRHCGWCSFGDQALWLPDPADFSGLMPILFEGDPDIDPARCHLVQYDAFGNLSIWSEEWQVITVSIDYGWVYCLALTDKKKGDPDNMVSLCMASLDSTVDGWVDQDGRPLWKKAVKKLGKLKPGECYGYAPLRSLGLGATLENVKRGGALAYMSIAAQMGGLTLMDWDGPQMIAVRPIGKN